MGEMRDLPRSLDEDGPGFDLGLALGVLRRSIWLIVATVLLSLGVAALALFALKPVYTATALVLVDPSQKNLLDPNAQNRGLVPDTARVDSEVQLVKSDATLLSVTRAMQLVVDPEFGAQLGPVDTVLAFLNIADPRLPSGNEALRAVIDRLSQAVSVHRVDLTYLIAINATSARPEFAADLANSIARTYIDIQLRVKQDSLRGAADVLSRSLEEGRLAVTRADNDFDTFLGANMGELEQVPGTADLRRVYRQLQDIKAGSADLGAALAQAETSLAAMDWDNVTASLQSDLLTELNRQRTALLERVRGSEAQGQPAAELRQQLDALNRGLEDAARSALSERRLALSQIEENASRTRGQLQAALVESNLPAEMQTRVFEFLQGIQIARTQYQNLLARQRDVALEVGLQVPDSRLASVATPPTRPSFPNVRTLLIVAALFGLMIGLALAFLIENFVGGFSAPDQVRSVLRVPVAASIPRQRSPRGKDGSVADALLTAPLSAFPEAVRRARIGIDLARRHRQAPGRGQVIMIASAAPAEGKTTMSVALARAYAASGASTVLVDCDLRKPGVHRVLGSNPDGGLIDYLEGRIAPEDVGTLFVTDPSGLTALAGSHRASVPTDQLVSGKLFRALLDDMRGRFDIVVLDTPPVGPVVDGLHLAALADVIALVIRWSDTPQQEVRATLDALMAARDDNAQVVAILNDVPLPRAAKKGLYAGYYVQEG